MRKERTSKSSPGSTEDKDAVDDVADLPHESTGEAKDGIVYRNDLGKTLKIDGDPIQGDEDDSTGRVHT